jgi:hypothetical protein
MPGRVIRKRVRQPEFAKNKVRRRLAGQLLRNSSTPACLVNRTIFDYQPPMRN